MSEKNTYRIPERCHNCGEYFDNRNIEFDVVSMSNGELMTKIKCLLCGAKKAISKDKNLAKRTNSALNNWASRVIKMYPSCRICGSKDRLEAHHIIPVSHSKRYMYFESNCLTLCHNCHLLVHNREEDVRTERKAKLITDNLYFRYCSVCGEKYDIITERGFKECRRCGALFEQ